MSWTYHSSTRPLVNPVFIGRLDIDTLRRISVRRFESDENSKKKQKERKKREEKKKMSTHGVRYDRTCDESFSLPKVEGSPTWLALDATVLQGFEILKSMVYIHTHKVAEKLRDGILDYYLLEKQSVLCSRNLDEFAFEMPCILNSTSYRNVSISILK